MTTDKLIVCAVDFSPGSEYAVSRAGELAKELGCPLELIHVYQLPIMALPDGVITATPAYVANLTTSAQSELDRHRKRLVERGVQAGTCLLEGQPALAIVEHAEKRKAMMLVLGTHGRTGFRHLVMGSVAERVARMATVPVLTVHLPQPQANASA